MCVHVLTVDSQLHRSVGHAHYVSGSAGQEEVVVVSAHVDQSYVDGMNGVVVVDSGLEEENRHS